MTAAASERRQQNLLAAGLLALFVAPRLALLVLRPRFFDETFTLWLSARPPAEIVDLLRLDSGPPLYYWLVHSLLRLPLDDLVSARLFSLLFGLVALAAVFLLGRPLGGARWIAALFLAIYPPHFHYSVEARSYAMAAALVAVAAFALREWLEREQRSMLGVAALSLLAAGYVHYYAVLLFPLPLLLPLLERKRRGTIDGALAAAAIVLFYIPGFVLARQQPEEAIGWMAGGGAGALAGAPLRLGFAAPYPPFFLADPHPLLIALAAIVTLLLAGRALLVPDGRRFLAVVLVPLLLALAFAVAARNVYFPLRFESVIAAPLVTALAIGAMRWGRRARIALVAIASGAGLIVSLSAISAQTVRAADPFADVARAARRIVPPDGKIVVSGLAYVELAVRTSEAWSPEIVALPREQEMHPGWVATADSQRLAEEVRALTLDGPAWWVGHVEAPELPLILGRFRVDPVYSNGALAIARLRPRDDHAAPSAREF